MTNEQMLEVSMEIGLTLLENGAEIYRVEESIVRILLAYGAKTADVFAVPTCLITNLVSADGQTYTRVKRIMHRTTNFDKISLSNDICRQLCNKTPDYETARNMLNELLAAKPFKMYMQIFGVMIIGFAFTIIFGGNFLDGIISFVICAVLKLILIGLNRFNTNMFFSFTLGSFVISILAYTFSFFNFTSNMDMIIIGSLMNLVPGVALTNSMRDIIATDFIAGLTKFVEAIMIAISIAIGSGIGIYLLKSYY